MTKVEHDKVKNAALALGNLIDCFRGIDGCTHAEFAGRNPYSVPEFKDAVVQVAALEDLLKASPVHKEIRRVGSW